MSKQDKQPGSGKAVAMTAVMLGVAMSIAANALHVVTVTPTKGGVSIPQVIGAMFWPVALLISVEVIARVSWPDNTGFAIVRWGGVGTVAVVAAIVSYRHMHGLLLYWREDWITALLGPIGVDGLVSVGAVALMAISHSTTTTATPVAPQQEAVTEAPKAIVEGSTPTPVPASAQMPIRERAAVEAVVPMVDLSGLRLPVSVKAKITDHLASGGSTTVEAIAKAGRVPTSIAQQVSTHVNGSLTAST